MYKYTTCISKDRYPRKESKLCDSQIMVDGSWCSPCVMD